MIKNNNTKLQLSEPNLIPLLDFMLVLVIMFVLLAGPIRQAIELPVPEVKAGSSKAIDHKNVLISLIDKNNFRIGEQNFTSLAQIEEFLKSQPTKITEITIATDKKLEVEVLMKVFAISKSLGISTANIQVDNEPQ
ncbi:MAG: biopolymer transporter ExbD [Neisseriales bacterium]|nr:MAG: biopolymer transporter ExbD [Neisseriales bacterium]